MLDQTETHIEFFVSGVPAPGGSKKAFVHNKTGKVVVQDDARRNKPWRDSVASAAIEAMGAAGPLAGPVELRVVFTMPRPKSHYHQGKRRHGQLRDDAPDLHTVKPDATKLLRSTEDALKGICWRDDSQVAFQTVVKRYGPRPGARVVVVPTGYFLEEKR